MQETIIVNEVQMTQEQFEEKKKECEEKKVRLVEVSKNKYVTRLED